jgi:hypothetical protein
MGAEATAKELPRLGLADALELTLLIARKDPRRHPRVAARWLLRYLEEDDSQRSASWPLQPPVSPRSPATATRRRRRRSGT